MNDEFQEYLDKFICVYLDDILVYSENLDDHLRHLRLTLDTYTHPAANPNRRTHKPRLATHRPAEQPRRDVQELWMDAGREPVTMGEKHWTETCREELQKEGGVPTGCRRKLYATCGINDVG